MTIRSQGSAYLISELPAIVAGKVKDRYGIRKVFIAAFVHSLMLQVGAAFETKSQGGVDNLGHSFKPLSKKTIAKKSTPSFRRKYPNSLPTQIMRASDRLLRSYSAGAFTSEEKYKPSRHQAVEVRGSLIKIYSKLPYAEYQSAKRSFWPNDISPWITVAISAGLAAVKQRVNVLQ